MLAIERSVAIITILFGPLSAASSLTSQLQTSFSAQFTGISDEVRISICTAPSLLPPCEQPLLSMSSDSRLWGNVNMLTHRGNDKRYLQVSIQATGNYVVTAMLVVRKGKLEADNVKLKHGRLDILPPRTILGVSRLVDAISLRDLSSNRPVQLAQFHQVWRVRAGRHVSVIANGDGFSANAESQALSNTAAAQNTRVRMVSGQVASGVVDVDGNILINL